MRKNYTYCMLEDSSCLHRRGCRRWIGNYQEDEAEEIEATDTKTIDETKCIPNYKDKGCENSFDFLDRFRLSTGEPFKTGDKNKR